MLNIIWATKICLKVILKLNKITTNMNDLLTTHFLLRVGYDRESFTLEAGSNSISFWHYHFREICTIKLCIWHQCSCKRFPFQLVFFICVVTETKINWLIIDTICLTYGITNKSTLTSVGFCRQWRQPLQVPDIIRSTGFFPKVKRRTIWRLRQKVNNISQSSL